MGVKLGVESVEQMIQNGLARREPGSRIVRTLFLWYDIESVYVDGCLPSEPKSRTIPTI